MKKYTWFIVGALLCGLFLGHNLLAHGKPRRIGDVISENFCQKWFDGINDVYFNNTLPPTKVKFDTIDSALVGITYCTLNLQTDSYSACTIHINRKYNLAEPVAAETVIHETCHVATYVEREDHGPRWQTCMLDLAKRGAFKGVW